MLSLRYQRILCRIILSLIISIVLLQLFAQDTSVLLLTQITSATSASSSSTCPIDISCTDSANAEIPNIVNFVYILADPKDGQFGIQFSQYLSIYAASYRWRPDTIYLHTNVDVSSNAVQQAKSGNSGQWAQRFFDVPNLKISTVDVPTHTALGKEIRSVEHQSDFVRVQALHDHGGIYIDLDVHALQDITPLRKSGYSAIGGKQFGGSLNSGAFMAAPYSRLTKEWMQRMHKVYDGGWTTHSNSALTAITHQLSTNERCEMMALPQAAFAPVGWLGFDQQRLFDNHYAAQDLRQVVGKDSLADFAQDHRSSMLDWAHDFHCTYLLHAFSIKKMRHGFTDNGISPRYVLERRSVFARTVYPILQDMYRNGHVNESDFGSL